MANSKVAADFDGNSSSDPLTSAERLPAPFVAASFAAFGDILNPKAHDMVAVAKLAIIFAGLDSTRNEMIIDRRAVVQAVYAYGVAVPVSGLPACVG